MTAPARESSTVILARNGSSGLEVFMVRRHLNSDFVGGAYVFPGGRLDESDCDPALGLFYGGMTADVAGAALGLAPWRALGHWGAAIRETFEEAGVLLAARNGVTLALSEEATRERFAEWRRRLLDGEVSWAEFLAAEQLQLDCDQVHYYAHWITPEGAPKRYTTRFFLALAPEEQTPLPDDREVVAGEWVAPQEALARHARGEMTMIFPTLRTLEELSVFASAEAAVAACAGRVVTARLPRIAMKDGAVAILMPGDPGYEEAGTMPATPFTPGQL